MAKLYLGSREITPIVKKDIITYNVKSSAFIGEINNRGVLVKPTSDINIVFNGVKDIANEALFRKFNGNTLVKSVSFPDLEEVSGDDSVYLGFGSCSNLETISIPKLKTISGETAFAGAFCYTKISEINFEILEEVSSYGGLLQVCTNNSYLTKAYFPKLNSLDEESCLYNAFANCPNIEDIYFNSLTSSSFGSYDDQFDALLESTGTSKTHTIHFPSNLQSTIENLLGYPTFGGSSSSVVLAFDLDPTE